VTQGLHRATLLVFDRDGRGLEQQDRRAVRQAIGRNHRRYRQRSPVRVEGPVFRQGLAIGRLAGQTLGAGQDGGRDIAEITRQKGVEIVGAPEIERGRIGVDAAQGDRIEHPDRSFQHVPGLHRRRALSSDGVTDFYRSAKGLSFG